MQQIGLTGWSEERQVHDYRGACSLRALQFNGAAVQFNAALDHHQAQAAAGPVADILPAEERLENKFLILAGYANSPVTYGEDRLIAFTLHLQANRLARG